MLSATRESTCMIIKTLRRKKLVDDKHHSKNFTNPNHASDFRPSPTTFLSSSFSAALAAAMQDFHFD